MSNPTQKKRASWHRVVDALKKCALALRNVVPRIRAGWHSVVGELKKCTWPTVPELRESTVVVVVTVLILTTWVTVADVVCGHVVRFLTK